MNDFDPTVLEIADAPQNDFDVALAKVRGEYARAWEASRPERLDDFRVAVRDAVLDAFDNACREHSANRRVEDRDLPELFRALDALCGELL